MLKASKFSTGFLVGFGAGFVSRDLIANGSSYFKPSIKGVMRVGMKLVEKGRESIASFTETLEDLMAEVRSETITPEAAAVEVSPVTVNLAEEPMKKPSSIQKS